MPIQDLPDHTSYLRATNAPGVAVLQASAAWCSQCKAIAPFVAQLAESHPNVRFYRYDTDNDAAGAIAQELGANLLPSFHIFAEGDLSGSVTGAKPQELERAVKEAVAEAEKKGGS